mgnify:CR=1 FL=1
MLSNNKFISSSLNPNSTASSPRFWFSGISPPHNIGKGLRSSYAEFRRQRFGVLGGITVVDGHCTFRVFGLSYFRQYVQLVDGQRSRAVYLRKQVQVIEDFIAQFLDDGVVVEDVGVDDFGGVTGEVARSGHAGQRRAAQPVCADDLLEDDLFYVVVYIGVVRGVEGLYFGANADVFTPRDQGLCRAAGAGKAPLECSLELGFLLFRRIGRHTDQYGGRESVVD